MRGGFTLGIVVILLLAAGFGGAIIGTQAGQYICYGDGDVWANSSISPWYATLCTLMGVFLGVLPFLLTIMALIWLRNRKEETR